ncbi:MAG: LysR family transcriptional regulator [Gammaproteobacteria bacterium]|nr:LysR family transcriptional regulator [Gammaproteobacteria bacterium]
MISFRQIRYFIATADAGKVSLAAAGLNVSQSAVSAAIKGLEEELEAHLFERHANGVTLTYEGHQFLQHAQNIVAAVSEATRAPRRSGRDVKGEVAVGVTYTVAGYFLPQILSRFRRAFPGVTVRMQEISRNEIEHRIVDGSLDVAVMLVSNLRNEAEIGSEVLIRSPRRLWLCADHHLMEKDAVSLAEVAHEPYVMLTVDEADRTALRYWTPTPYRPKVVFATSSVEAVRSMVALGMGVTILSNMVYRPWSLEGQHVEVRPVTDHVPSMDVGLAWRRGVTMSPPARVFSEYLGRTFRSSSHEFVDADVPAQGT